MSAKTSIPAHTDDDTVRVCLLAGVNFSDLANLFNHFSHRHCYQVCLDASNLLHLGTVEFRVLGMFAETFELNGGFLKLQNASTNVVALVCEFGLTDLMDGAAADLFAK